MVAQWRHRLKSCFSDCHTLSHEPKHNPYPRVSNQLPPTDELAFAEAAVTRSNPFGLVRNVSAKLLVVGNDDTPQQCGPDCLRPVTHV
jgi:hypothetical protein